MATYENNIEYAPFNSVGMDRAINANHLARWLSSVNSNGVARKFNEFEATAVGGMDIVIDTGVGFVEGHHIYLKASQTITIEAANNSSNRVDTIGFRLERENRKVVLYYNVGELDVEEAATPLDDGDILEIPLYNIKVNKGVTSINQSTDVTDVRKYVVSSATYFKKYNQNYDVTQTTSSVVITVPFNNETDDVDVLVNGIELLTTQYSISGNVITFNSAITSGNEIQVNVWHFQDGSGSMDNWEQVLTEMQKVQTVTKYYYQCSGVDDNKKLSDLAQHFLGGTDEFTGVNANAQMEVVVCGNCVVDSYYSGDGSVTRPYTYFAFGRASTSTRTIYFNFSNCSRITVDCPLVNASGGNAYSTIFSGADINVRNVALNVASGYNVDIFNGTNIHCEDSEFWMTTTGNCCVGKCCGLFENIRTSITSTSGNAYCFYGNGNLTRVIGGTHYAWTASSSGEAACFYVEAGQTANVLFISMVNCPQMTRSGYSQTDTIKINNGYATIMQSALWKASTLYNTTNCIAYGNVIISKN